jgi:hypothetical protein
LLSDINENGKYYILVYTTKADQNGRAV